MKRLPAALWLFAPLVLGLLYAAGYGLFAPSPTLETVVPRAAVLTQRFRDLDALDAIWFRRAGDVTRLADRLGAARALDAPPAGHG
ncbi:MAG: hypothetical protein ACC662_12080, partial [Planctomycetota bacterium]